MVRRRQAGERLAREVQEGVIRVAAAVFALPQLFHSYAVLIIYLHIMPFTDDIFVLLYDNRQELTEFDEK